MNAHAPLSPLLAVLILLLSLTLLIGISHFGFVSLVLSAIGLYAARMLWTHVRLPHTTSRATFQ